MNHMKRYRINSTRWLVSMKKKIPQAVSDKFIILKTVILKNVRMSSNNYIHPKRNQVFVYVLLGGDGS